MRDIILHALVLVAGDPDHRHRHLGGFGEGGRQRPYEPSGHTTQGSAVDDDLLGIRSDLQQSSRAGGVHGSELQVIRVECDAGARLIHPIQQLLGDGLARLLPRVGIVRLSSHIPRMRPRIDRVDRPAAQGRLPERPLQGRERLLGPSTPTTMSPAPSDVRGSDSMFTSGCVMTSSLLACYIQHIVFHCVMSAIIARKGINVIANR